MGFKSLFNATKQALSKVKHGFNALCLFVLGSTIAHASVLPTDVDTIFTETKTDILKVVGLALGLVLVIVAFRYVKRVLS